MPPRRKRVTGYYNTANGYLALGLTTFGWYNMANGAEALCTTLRVGTTQRMVSALMHT